MAAFAGLADVVRALKTVVTVKRCVDAADSYAALVGRALVSVIARTVLRDENAAALRVTRIAGTRDAVVADSAAPTATVAAALLAGTLRCAAGPFVTDLPQLTAASFAIQVYTHALAGRARSRQVALHPVFEGSPPFLGSQRVTLLARLGRIDGA